MVEFKHFMAMLVMLVMSALPLAGCETPPKLETPRDRLVAAEFAYQGALKEVELLGKQGFIKGKLAGDVQNAIMTVDAAIVAWRKTPDDPSLMSTGLAVLQPLLNLLVDIRAKKVSWWLPTGPFREAFA